MPFFRQTSVLQPFLFLFAAYGVVALGRRLARGPAVRLAATLALLVVVGALQWEQAHATFEGHQGIGRALAWVDANKGEHDVRWLPIAWSGGTTEVISPTELEALRPSTWLISYFPMLFVDNNPTLQPYLAAAPVVAAWPSLFTTDTLRAEHKGYGFNDWRADPVLRDVRVVEAGAIRAQMEGAPLQVASVTADSEASPEFEAGNVFDRDGAADRNTAWLSADTPMPHTLDVAFAAPVELGSVQVVLPTKDRDAKDQWASRIVDLEVQAAESDGAYRTVWDRDGARSPAGHYRAMASPSDGGAQADRPPSDVPGACDLAGDHRGGSVPWLYHRGAAPGARRAGSDTRRSTMEPGRPGDLGCGLYPAHPARARRDELFHAALGAGTACRASSAERGRGNGRT